MAEPSGKRCIRDAADSSLDTGGDPVAMVLDKVRELAGAVRSARTEGAAVQGAAE